MKTEKEYSIRELIRLGEEKNNLRVIPLSQEEPDNDKDNRKRSEKKE